MLVEIILLLHGKWKSPPLLLRCTQSSITPYEKNLNWNSLQASNSVDYCLIFLQLSEWGHLGVANLAGVISLAAGLLMWVTSLRSVRKWNFEIFFYTHQLYVVFVLFLAFHVGDFIFSFAAGAIFIFMLDRFLRFIQSRKTVDMISARSLPCGTFELVFSKPASK